MADLDHAPRPTPHRRARADSLGRAPARHAGAAAAAVDAAHPDRGRRPRRRGPRGPDDPRGLPRQRHRDPDPVLRAQAARLRRLPDVRRRGRGRGAPADLAARATCEPEMEVQTQTEEVRRLRRTNLELIFSDHNAYCLPPCQNKCPSHIDIPGFLKANAEGDCARVDADLQADHPVPERPRARLPGAVRGALPARRGGRGDRHPRHATATPATRSSRRCSTRASTRPCRSRSRPPTGRRAAVIGSGPAGMAAAYYLLLAGHDVTVFERDPAPGGMLRYGIPQYRLPKVEVLEAEYESVTRLGGKMVCNAGLGPRLHARRPARTRASTRSSSRSAATTRTSWASPARTPPRSSTASSTCAPRRSACPTRATPASASSSSAAASPRWTARGRRSARARPR